jgi:tetratricopeptide (TPR) repeat protein
MGDINNLTTAIAYYKDACQIKNKLFGGDLHKEIAILNHNIGVCYDEMGEVESAIRYKKRALDIRNRLGDLKEVIKCLNGLANTYEKMGDLEKMVHYDKLSLDVKKKVYIKDINNPDIAERLYLLGIGAFKLKNWLYSVECFEQAYEMYKIFNEKNLSVSEKKLTTILYHIYVCRMQMGQIEEADRFRQKYERITNEKLDMVKLDSLKVHNPSQMNYKLPAISAQRAITSANTSKLNFGKDIKDWDKKDVKNYLQHERVHSELVEALCSTSSIFTPEIDGKILKDYFLLMSHNMSFFVQFLLLETDTQIRLSEFNRLRDALRKLF